MGAAKAFQKKAQAKKAEERAAEKSKTLKDIKDWKRQHKQDTQVGEDRDLETILSRQGKRGEDGDGKGDGKGKSKGKGKGTRSERKSLKQRQKDAKYGYG